VEWLSDPQIWAGLLTLTALEIVLGIDNLLFITILAGRLPAQLQVVHELASLVWIKLKLDRRQAGS
jgi:predicted tellurium resistance membrane protein TerC